MIDENVGAQIIADATKIARLTTSTENSGRIIVATGRGGTGKSTFVALLARYVRSPLLLLDIDPDQCLASMLGIDLEAVKIETEVGREIPIETLSDVTRKIEEEDAFAELGGGPPTAKIPLLLQWYTTYHSEKFDLISLGTRWTEGDYRSANFLFEFIIPSIGENYTNIVIDSPAGLEHLNRRIASEVDDIFDVIDPSQKSFKHVERAKRIIEEVKIEFKNFYVIAGYRVPEELEDQIKKRTKINYLGKIAYDKEVEEYVFAGKPLLELPSSSTAYNSVKQLMRKAGY